jgi:hypothetical protein
VRCTDNGGTADGPAARGSTAAADRGVRDAAEAAGVLVRAGIPEVAGIPDAREAPDALGARKVPTAAAGVASLTALLASLTLGLAGCGARPPAAPEPASAPPPVASTPSPPAAAAPVPAPAPAAAAAAPATAPSKRSSRFVAQPPAPAPRNMTDFQRQFARRLVDSHPDASYLGTVPPRLLAIPVLEIEFNADGSVRGIRVVRQPSTGPEATVLAIEAVRRAGPYGSVAKLPKPWKIIEAFLFDDDLRFKPRTLDLP